jgi:hypothetical protein
MMERKVKAMLLDSEKDGIGPRRLTRATAYLEAAHAVERLACLPHVTKATYREMIDAADLLRQKATEERSLFDRECARIEMTQIAQSNGEYD